MRPEHAREMLAVRRRPLVGRAWRALDRLHTQARTGSLPTDARWILRTRLVFLEKPGSPTPRPIRIGEFLRSSMAKRLLNDARPRLRTRFLASHQWGVALPGGAEALVHWRSTVEEMAREGLIPPLIAFDLDLKNMFGSIEWPRIRAAIATHFPEAAA